MKIKLLFPITIVLILSCGCSQYWYQEAKTFDQCTRDRQGCFEELKKRSDFGNVTVDYEIKFMEECMTKKGYEAVEQEKLPLDIKRQEPPSSFHWRARGVAGELIE